MAKKKQARLALIALLAAGSVGAAYGFTAYKEQAPRRVLEQYFSCWEAKDEDGMRALLYGEQRDWPIQFGTAYLEYVRLLSCEEETRPEQQEIDLETARKFWDPQVSEVKKFYVSFDIQYMDGAPRTWGWENMKYDWYFYLAKESARDEWRIISSGV